MLIAGGSLLAAALVLGLLVVTMPGDATNGFDDAWNRIMAGTRQPWMLAAAYALNSIGGGWVAILLVPGLVAGLLIVLRRWRSAVYAVVAFAASAALVQLVKEIYGRARPADMLVTSDYGSFPSGHTANAATIAVVLWLIFPRRWLAALGLLWTLAMALSRTVLSVHWLTDTAGGLLVGASAALLVGAGFATWAALGRRLTRSEEAEVDARLTPDAGPREPAVAAPEPTAVAPGEAPASSIRPYRPSDRAAMYDVCVRTADAGADATGLFTDDRLWGDVFAVPYVERHPDLAWVVESGDGRTIGYVVATDDTDAFEAWFRDEWWPRVRDHHPLSGEAEPTRQDAIIRYAEDRAPGREPHATAYPAHLHIDLLPETQGQGLGRRLIDTLFDELRRRGVPGLHLGMNPGNTGAGAFYERIGMHRLESGPETTMYGIRFDG